MDRLEELRSRFNREVSNLKSASNYDTDSRTKISSQSKAVPATYYDQRNPLIQQYQSHRSDNRNNEDSNYDLERHRYQNRSEYNARSYGAASETSTRTSSNRREVQPKASSSRRHAPNDSYHPHFSADQELQSENKRPGKYASASIDPYSVEDELSLLSKSYSFP